MSISVGQQKSLNHIVYHISLPHFRDGNEDGFGDFIGVEEKLDYIADAVGATAIWFSPIFLNEMNAVGPGVVDHAVIDPRYGDRDELNSLIAAARRKGLAIYVDPGLVTTSRSHPWFEESRMSPRNNFRNWYIWAPEQAQPDSNDVIDHTESTVWVKDGDANRHYLATRKDMQPVLNWSNPQFREKALSIVQFCLQMGFDGVLTGGADRAVTRSLGFGDLSANMVTDVSTWHENLTEVRSGVSGCLIDGIQKRDLASGLDLIDLPGGAYPYCGLHSEHRINIVDLDANLPNAKYMKHYLQELYIQHSVDDQIFFRLVSDLKNDPSSTRLQRLKLAALLLYSLDGGVITEFGNELGLLSLLNSDGAFGDNANGSGRYFGSINHIEMPWKEDNVDVYTTSERMGVEQNMARSIAVERQLEIGDSFLAYIGRLAELRRDLPALSNDSFRLIDVGNDEVLAYLRDHAMHRCLVMLNLSSHGQQDVKLPSSTQDWLIGTHGVYGGHHKGDLHHTKLAAYEGRLYEFK